MSDAFRTLIICSFAMNLLIIGAGAGLIIEHFVVKRRRLEFQDQSWPK